MGQWLSSLGHIKGPVTQREYQTVGFTLMALKYLVDAVMYYFVVGGLWHPLDYLNPVYSMRMAGAPPVGTLPHWYPVFLLLWGLGFAWIGATWSARRALDARLSPWLGLLFFVPIVNYLLIGMLILWPSRPRFVESQEEDRRSQAQEREFSRTTFTGLGLLAAFAVVYAMLTMGLGSYSSAVFLALPLALGVGAGALMGRTGLRSIGKSALFSFLSTLIACLGLLLFAAEGIVCLAMAFPVVFLAIFVGTLLSDALRDLGGAEGTPGRGTLCLVLVLPLSAWLDTKLPPTPAREVRSSIEIDAPVEIVWEHVVSFAELPEPDSWFFRTGLAYPMRARIEGRGVGAVRYCEFSTGPFVEPITVWEEPHRLAFDVIEQPVPMEEWSFYDDIRPPHLTKTFRSLRGEFRLQRLPGGRTRLEGSTWYTLDMAPEVYWRLWGDAVLHRVHERVLRHVRSLSEREAARQAG